MNYVHSIKSWLFAPANRPERFRKGAEAGAGALIIDLEDAVPPFAKAEARATALKYLEGICGPHFPCALRVNALGTRVGLDDVQAFVSSSAQPDYLALPKCESASEIGLVSGWLRQAGKSAEIIVQIETAKGMAALDGIVRAPNKPAALVFGAADMAADLGAEVAWEPLLFARSRLVLAASTSSIHCTSTLWTRTGSGARQGRRPRSAFIPSVRFIRRRSR